ncbi:MAG: hemerythrin domain-containing protein [Pseudomonadota bacterium]|nr:hemerythrin domain-containing protein [Pseudomonadota bacterium]
MDPIDSFMHEDQRFINELWKNTQGAASYQTWELAQHFLDTFIQGLLLHIDIEEKILFPALEERQGWSDGPTSLMRREHDEIKYQLHQLKTMAEEWSVDEFRETGDLLTSLMELHNSREKIVFYPLCTQAMGIDTEEMLSLAQAQLWSRSRNPWKAE